MKSNTIYGALFLGALFFSSPCTGLANADSLHYRDSLYRHITENSKATLDCRFTYEQGSSGIIESLGHNKEELLYLNQFIETVTSHPELYMERICLTGYSSIEGSYRLNEDLARERANGFYYYLRSHYPLLENYPFDIAWVAEDWTGLSKIVSHSKINERDEILEIIRKVRDYDDREALLMKLNGGRAYAEMAKEMLPKLRRVEIEITYSRTKPVITPKPTLTVNDETLTIKPEVVPQLPAKKEAAVKKEDETTKVENENHNSNNANTVPPSLLPPGERGGGIKRFAIKTNLLLWAGIQSDFKYTTYVPNVAVEYYINQNWSVEIGAMYSYWHYNNNDSFQGISGYRVEPRYKVLPFQRKAGIYLGPYIRFGDYDLRKAQPDVAHCYTGNYWDAGLSVGFILNLVGGLDLEAGIRSGYVSTNAFLYTQEDEYNWLDGRESYGKIRVTDLNVSLIYRF